MKENKKKIAIIISVAAGAALLAFFGLIALWQSLAGSSLALKLAGIFTNQPASIAAAVKSPFYYTFNTPGALQEAGAMDDSWSPYWWLNSGGYFPISNGLGSTNRGELSFLDKWRLAYSRANPVDTDNGYHPQNIFRLITRSRWQNVSEQAYFKIDKINMSDSPNRNESNGLLLFNRYYDSQNLYYMGVRVDGAAVIKKKIGGVYFTVAYKKIFPSGVYDRAAAPNYIPTNTWIGLKSEVSNTPSGKVEIRLYTDVGETGNWTLVLSATDDGKTYGGGSLTESAYAGIRTDFMDVEFKNFRIVNL